MEQTIYRYWLANLENIGNKKIERLLEVFESAREVYHATGEELSALRRDGAFGGLIGDKEIASILHNRDIEQLNFSYNKLIQSGIYFVTREDNEYPEKLQNIYGAPYGLYIKGHLPAKEDKLLAVVGARECSSYGIEMAKYLTGAVAKEGIKIISGLARGIDSYAHLGALSCGGVSYAVLGCGIDLCYPRENINLYMEMQKEGGIISEYAPGIQPIAGNFPMRNRIISGLSDGILVIEAKERSGSLITVDYGLEQGKDIYALPGRATDRLSEGCNNLIKLGAKPVTSPKDILEELLPHYDDSTSQRSNCHVLLNEPQEKIYSCLTSDPKHIDEIGYLTRLPIDLLMEQILVLELRGLIRQTRMNYYCIINNS